VRDALQGKSFSRGCRGKSGELLTWGKSYKELLVQDAASTTTSNPNEEYLADKIQEEYCCYVVDQTDDQIKDVKGRPHRGCGKPPEKP
jgi:hypothetical protein